MKVRKELNARLYRNKMDELAVPGRSWSAEKTGALCRGDLEKVSEMLRTGELGFVCGERSFSRDPLRNALYHFVLSASVLADICMDAGMGRSEACTLSGIYIRKADDCRAVPDVFRLFDDLCLDFTERMGEIRTDAVGSVHIRKCIDYIYENLGADLSLKAMAGIAGLSPSYLSKLFHRETGMSLGRFVREAKVDTARNLLLYTDMPYLRISASLGFSTQSVFISAFREITGSTPKVFRESNRR